MASSLKFLNRDEQIQQAATFERESGPKIDLARQAILAAGGRILQSSLANVLDESERDALKMALDAGDVTSAFQLLRPLAARFVIANCSGVYWQWIDATNCFSDAVGSWWPYMTMERRAINITEAEVDANRILP